MVLYFENSYGKRREIGRPQSTKETYQLIDKFLKDYNYKSYYIRSWKNDENETYYDVGSWSEFFVMIE